MKKQFVFLICVILLVSCDSSTGNSSISTPYQTEMPFVSPSPLATSAPIAMIPFTPPPTLPANLPDLPNGFTWKLIQETQIGFPIRDGWFFTEESIEAGTSYHVAKEQTGEVGVFSNGLTVEVLEANNAIKAIDEAKYSVDIAINALITKKIIDKQQYSEGNIASFQAIVEQEYVNLPINDPNRRRTIFIKTIANTETNILYRIRFESPSTLWDEEWQTGQIMTQVVLLTQ